MKRRAAKTWLMVFLLPLSATAADHVWTDGGLDGNWANAANWIGGGYPDGPDDTAMITNSSRAITVPAGLTVGEITIAGTYTGTHTLAGALVVTATGGKSGNLTLNAGALQTVSNAVGDLSVSNSLTVGTNAVLVVRLSSTSGDGAGQTIRAGSMDLFGTVSADLQGFGALTGPGKGVNRGGSFSGTGGGYGGVGGLAADGTNYPGGSTYDSVTNVGALGSGGGASTGGRGGGAITLVVAGSLNVAGTLSACGGPATANAGGGGSGGSLVISAGILAGGGTIDVQGGNGRNMGTSGAGGGGGGGRIDVSRVAMWSFLGTLTAAGGARGSGSGCTWSSSHGFAGTILWPSNFNLVVGTGGLVQVVMNTDGTNVYDFASITVSSGGVLQIGGDPNANEGVGGTPTIRAPTVVVNAGGVLRADAQGFDTGFGSGFGAAAHRGPGGGYGGVGGQGVLSSTPVAGGAAYGTSNNPVCLGSGGGVGIDYYGPGGSGGGALCLVASQSMTINGIVSADGETAYSGKRGGGGSGGSVILRAKRLSGNGIIRANGGAGDNGGGGGGGGRVLISGYDYSSDYRPFAGSVQAAGGSGGGGAAGQAGTIAYYLPPPPRGTVVYFK